MFSHSRKTRIFLPDPQIKQFRSKNNSHTKCLAYGWFCGTGNGGLIQKLAGGSMLLFNLRGDESTGWGLGIWGFACIQSAVPYDSACRVNTANWQFIVGKYAKLNVCWIMCGHHFTCSVMDYQSKVDGYRYANRRNTAGLIGMHAHTHGADAQAHAHPSRTFPSKT